MEKLMSQKHWEKQKLGMFIVLLTLPVLSVLIIWLRDWRTLTPSRIMNLGMDLIGICVLTLIFVSTIKDRDDITLRTGTFSYIITHNALALFIDQCCWCVNGIPRLHWLNMALFTFIYILNVVIIMMFWQYLVQVSESNDPRLQKLTKILNGGACIAIATFVVNFFGEFYFYVDNVGVYHRGNLFLASQVFNVLLFFNIFMLITQLNLDKKKKEVLALFVSIPSVAAIAQVMTQGLSIIYVGTMLALVMIYSNVFAEHSQEITQQKVDLLLKEKEIAQAEEEHRQLETELNLAADIQAHMIPATFPAFPDHPEFSLYANMDPAKEVGGDFYDFFLVDDTHLALVIADVSGKGVPAALYMMVAKTMIKNAAIQGMNPSAVLEFVNNQLCEGTDEVEMFVTAWLGIVDLTTGKVTAVNAGHEYPAICRQSGQFELYKDRHGFVMGGMPDMKYKEYEFTLSEGDTLMVYTDGVTEATNPYNELFGTDRMLAALNTDPHEDPEKLIPDLRHNIDEFVGYADQFDDITILAFKMKGGAKQNPLERKLCLVPDGPSMVTVQAMIDELMEEAGVPMNISMRVGIVVDELYSNIINYSGATSAEVRGRADQNGVELWFEDNGVPYNPLAAKDPDITLGIDERKVGGLGILISKKLMDNIEYKYEDGKNQLHMIKKA